MYIDALTVSAILVSLAVLAAVVVIVQRTRRQMREELRRFVIQQEHIRHSADCGEYCEAICRLFPASCPGVDFLVHDTEEGPRIAQWHMKTPPPKHEHIQRLISEAKKAKKD